MTGETDALGSGERVGILVGEVSEWTDVIDLLDEPVATADATVLAEPTELRLANHAPALPLEDPACGFTSAPGALSFALPLVLAAPTRSRSGEAAHAFPQAIWAGPQWHLSPLRNRMNGCRHSPQTTDTSPPPWYSRNTETSWQGGSIRKGGPFSQPGSSQVSRSSSGRRVKVSVTVRL